MLTDKRILLIDDNKDDILIVKRQLKDNIVIAYEDPGKDISSLVLKEKPDCILLDYKLKGKDGLEFLSDLKNHEEAKKYPVIILTGLDRIELAIQSTKYGACDFLIKNSIDEHSLKKSIYLAIERQNLVNLIYEQQEKLQKLATTDDLTNLCNRRLLIKKIEETFKHSKRYKDPFSLCLIDMDNFKLINDKYGHLAGDRALKELASLIQERIRETDVLGRYGGDEFIIIFYKTDLFKAIKAANDIRNLFLYSLLDSKSIDENSIIYKIREDKLPVSLSFGLAAFSSDLKTADSLIAKADRALYFAKNNGKNVVAYNYLDQLQIYHG